MFKKKITGNDVMNGTFGSIWINGDKAANVKKFEAKLTLNYEQVDIAEDPGEHQKFMGYTGSGTITLHKVDSSITSLMYKDIKKGKVPTIMIVGKLDDPAATGSERIQFTEVTFDELTLLNFEQKALMEEEVPFKFADFTPLDLIK
ncbi:MAG: phage tail tube protein [Firmicutes bacterium]|nr:phage tail tube protein [Bacillota bacterium]